MQSNDPFAPPSTSASGGMAYPGVQAYPEGFYQPIESFDLNRMLAAPFKSPNWLTNLLWMFVCDLLSVVVIGTLIKFGYMAEVAEARSGGRSENWPDFTWDRFSDYLMRGLWPFLWNLIWTIPLLIVIGIPIGITITLTSFLVNNNNEVPGVIVFVTGMVVMLAIYFCAVISMTASMMHAALGNDFMKGADIGWISSYVSKMWRTTIFAGIVFALVGIAVNILGMLFFCVGLLVAVPLLSMMTADLMSQLHDIFVSRGGRSAFSGRQGFESNIIEAQVIL